MHGDYAFRSHKTGGIMSPNKINAVGYPNPKGWET